VDLSRREFVNIDKIQIEKYALIIIAVFAVLTRCWYYGDPIVQIDEEFYLYVGDRMHAGLLPYLDIWDRKPIGLFLIYAAIRMLGGSGIIQYQLVATAFAAGTAFVLYKIARYDCRPWAAMCAALLYLVWIPVLGGQGGQAPVFYNLFVALAAWAILHARKNDPLSVAGLFGFGTLAMALIGVALQVKYTVVFEGFFFGLYLTYLALRSATWPVAILMAAAWALIALIPTVAATGFYALKGHLDIYIYSNFLSIFQRRPVPMDVSLSSGLHLFAHLSVVLALTILGAYQALSRRRGTPSAGFVVAWAAVSVLAVIAFGYYFTHYGLPIVAPAAVCAAYLLNSQRRYRWVLPAMGLGLGLALCLILPTLLPNKAGTARQFDDLTRIVKPYASRGLFLWGSFPALFYATHAPLLTRYPFPYHFFDPNELGAVGVDQQKELVRVMAARPEVIVRGGGEEPITSNAQLLLDDLARDYHQIGSVKVGSSQQQIYILNANIPPHPVYPPDQPPPR
jgi:hypothetical protein